MAREQRLGVLLVNVGSASAPTPAAARSFLREFLCDGHVVDMPAPLRWLLVNLVIVPSRARHCAEMYRSIWRDDGSPLLAISEQVRTGIAERMPEAHVAAAMRYGVPSLEDGLEQLAAAGVERIVAAPLFPQYANATTGSIEDRLGVLAKRRTATPEPTFLRPFHANDAFIEAWAELVGESLAGWPHDHILLSYHGLPVSHIRKADKSGTCLTQSDCCATLTSTNQDCYRAQCFATSRALAKALNLSEGSYTTSFQSRLGRRPWIGPATADVLRQIASAGHRRLAVICPSFTADCLETLLEIDVEARKMFLDAGGQDFFLVPSLNADARWLDALTSMLRDASA
jgi:protoporphyrin/coproporphyrin ferrochelatase